MRKIYLASALLMSQVCSMDIPQQEFRGNWTETFQTTIGPIIHTPDHVQYAYMTGGRGIRLATPSVNGVPLRDALDVQTNSTRNEFVEALMRAGIYGNPGDYERIVQQREAAQRQEAQQRNDDLLNLLQRALQEAVTERAAETSSDSEDEQSEGEEEVNLGDFAELRQGLDEIVEELQHQQQNNLAVELQRPEINRLAAEAAEQRRQGAAPALTVQPVTVLNSNSANEDRQGRVSGWSLRRR